MENLFQTTLIRNYLDARLKKVKEEIFAINDETAPANEYYLVLIENYKITPILLELSNDKIQKSMSPKSVPVDLGRGEHSTTGRKIIQIIRYSIFHNQHLNPEIFNCQPSMFSTNSIAGEVDSDVLSFEVIVNYPNENLPPEKIDEAVSQRDRNIQIIQQNIDRLNKDIERFNNELPSIIMGYAKERTDRIAARNSVMNRL